MKTNHLLKTILFSIFTIQIGFAQSVILTPAEGVKANKLHDSDNNTRVEVEKTPDDDKIRFYLKGKEVGVLDSNAFQLEFGSRNTFIGKNTGLNNSTGSANVALGFQSLRENNGSYNTAIGTESLKTNSNGGTNTAIGYASLQSAHSSSHNSALGHASLAGLKSGNSNVAIGYQAGILDTLGNKNVYIGAFSGGASNFPIARTREKNVFLGYASGQYEYRSNRLYIENSDSKTPLIYGNFEDDSLKVNGNLEVTENLNTTGFTQLGDESPAIKLKTITGTSPASEGISVSIAHGLSHSKIINVSVYVNNSAQNWIPPNYDGGPNYEYDYYFNGTSVVIKNMAGNSDNMLSKPLKILITYIE